MRIAVFEAGERERAAFRDIAPGHDVRFAAEPLNAANAGSWSDLEIVSTFVASQLSQETLSQLPALRFVATRLTGFDHIDMAFCLSRGIAVSNVPTYGEATVAEHGFALLLAISHRLLDAVRQAKTRFSPEGLQGFDLAGKTLSVIGTGSIGRHMVRIAKGFGMNVLAHDIAPDEDFGRRLGVAYVPLGELLRSADIVSLHVPATEQTRNLLGQSAFAQMRDGVILINAARGSVIDPWALISALHSGKVAAAGLDVLPAEPLLRQEGGLAAALETGKQDLRDLTAAHILMRMPNVIVTPHSAFNTREALERILNTSVANVEAFLKGRPVNVVR